MAVILALAAITIAYVLGSIPMGVFAARFISGAEIREVGSGRTGATNAYRAAGPWGAALTSGGDLLKGVAAVWIARFLMMLTPARGLAPWVETLAGIAVVVGHNWSVFLGFRGGAGTATTVGVLGAMNAYAAIGICLAGLIALAASRTASIGSITVAILMTVALTITAAVGATPWAYLLFGAASGVLTIWALRPNIRRLLTREERQLKTNY